jgi:predicted membrane channel-forming protein YqfA (hemolysin III family)
MPFYGTAPTDTDTIKQLGEKIVKAANSENEAIKWRKAFILSVIIAGFIWVLAAASLPSWQIFYTSVFLGSLILYFTSNYYDYHIFATPRKHIADAVDKIVAKSARP